jgi:hypothetical protein
MPPRIPVRAGRSQGGGAERDRRIPFGIKRDSSTDIPILHGVDLSCRDSIPHGTDAARSPARAASNGLATRPFDVLSQKCASRNALTICRVQVSRTCWRCREAHFLGHPSQAAVLPAQGAHRYRRSLVALIQQATFSDSAGRLRDTLCLERLLDLSDPHSRSDHGHAAGSAGCAASVQ